MLNVYLQLCHVDSGNIYTFFKSIDPAKKVDKDNDRTILNMTVNIESQ